MLASLMPTAALADKSDTDIAYAVTGGYIYFDKSAGTITDCDISVTTAVIPETIENVSVTSIGDEAFSWCRQLTSVTIPDSVTSIGNSAFQQCVGLTSITIPSSVTSIGGNAFNICTSLKSINVSDENTAYCSVKGVLLNKDKTEFIKYPDGKTGVSYTIPDSVTSISDYAFYYCTSLTSIDIPNSVTSIGERAFSGCSSLTSIDIPNSVKSIGNAAFYWCESLTNITIPDGVTNIGERLFQTCTSLMNVTIPDSVTSVGIFAFYACTSLTSVTIPDSVTSIGLCAFAVCTSLKDVYYSGSAEQWKAISIGSSNEPLTSAAIHYNYDSHEHNYTAAVTAPTCTEQGYTTYTCECGDSYIDNYTDALGHTEVVDTAVAATCTTAGLTEGQHCSVCNEILIEQEVAAALGHDYVNHVCSRCGAVDSDSVVASGTCGAEGDGSNLTWVLYNDGVLEISGTGAMASWGWNSAPWSSYLDIHSSNVIKSVIINAGVTSIGDFAFHCAYNKGAVLTSITIPDSVTSIGKDAFYGCTNLTNIDIPNSITSIGRYAFENCTGLTSITIPNSVTSIGEGAFKNCTGLTRERFRIA